MNNRYINPVKPCGECGRLPIIIWVGEQTIHHDEVDGDLFQVRHEGNMRFVCPSCHRTTPVGDKEDMQTYWNDRQEGIYNHLQDTKWRASWELGKEK